MFYVKSFSLIFRFVFYSNISLSSMKRCYSVAFTFISFIEMFSFALSLSLSFSRSIVFKHLNCHDFGYRFALKWITFIAISSKQILPFSWQTQICWILKNALTENLNLVGIFFPFFCRINYKITCKLKKMCLSLP